MNALRNSSPIDASTLFLISKFLAFLSQIALAVLTKYSLSTVILCDGKVCRLYMESCKFSVLSAPEETVPLPLEVLENFEETQAECCAFP